MIPPLGALDPSAAAVVAICGKARVAVSALSYAFHHIATSEIATRLVVVPSGGDRGYDGWQPSLRRAAAMLGVPVVRLADLQAERGLLLISLEYDRIVRVERFASSRLYNFHFSALPRYRGVLTSVWPLLNEEASSGVTLHEMDAGADTGPVVGQRLFPIPPYMTARQLYETYMDEALMLFREWFPVLLKERPPARAQDEADASAYTRASLDLSKCEIDFDLPAQRVCSFVRAFTFPEYQLPTIAGRAVRSAAALPGVHPRPAGSRLSETPYSTVFVAGDGGLVEVIWA